jgi:hypothetical protein
MNHPSLSDIDNCFNRQHQDKQDNAYGKRMEESGKRSRGWLGNFL